MSKIPIAGPTTEGRTFGKDWSIAHVAKLLRSNAERGHYNASVVSGSELEVNRYYLRKVSAGHMPTNVSLIFMRLVNPNCWYASLCFAGGYGFQPWNEAVAESWLAALFGADRPRVRDEVTDNPSVRQFYCDVI
jgi:hypothetical protein